VTAPLRRRQQVDATTMRSELTSLQAIYAPWTNAAGPFFPPLNTAVTLIYGGNYFPTVDGQLLFDARADVGLYEDRGDPAYVQQNKDFQRFGSKFGYALTATPSNMPTPSSMRKRTRPDFRGIFSVALPGDRAVVLFLQLSATSASRPRLAPWSAEFDLFLLFAAAQLPGAPRQQEHAVDTG
jgi:hypothetical protein